jgi:hypothetical protein
VVLVVVELGQLPLVTDLTERIIREVVQAELMVILYLVKQEVQE